MTETATVCLCWIQDNCDQQSLALHEKSLQKVEPFSTFFVSAELCAAVLNLYVWTALNAIEWVPVSTVFVQCLRSFRTVQVHKDVKVKARKVEQVEPPQSADMVIQTVNSKH